MDDSKIIELYFERDNRAIKETQIKYGKLCHKIAYNILIIMKIQRNVLMIHM
jgi:RNA polymerase sigma-70 factor (ECF subfamily)